MTTYVRVLKKACDLFVPIQLTHGHHALFNLGWMMCVVTQEYNPVILDFKVEPAVHTPETGHSLFDLFS